MRPLFRIDNSVFCQLQNVEAIEVVVAQTLNAWRWTMCKLRGQTAVEVHVVCSIEEDLIIFILQFA